MNNTTIIEQINQTNQTSFLDNIFNNTILQDFNASEIPPKMFDLYDKAFNYVHAFSPELKTRLLLISWAVIGGLFVAVGGYHLANKLGGLGKLITTIVAVALLIGMGFLFWKSLTTGGAV